MVRPVVMFRPVVTVGRVVSVTRGFGRSARRSAPSGWVTLGDGGDVGRFGWVSACLHPRFVFQCCHWSVAVFAPRSSVSLWLARVCPRNGWYIVSRGAASPQCAGWRLHDAVHSVIQDPLPCPCSRCMSGTSTPVRRSRPSSRTSIPSARRSMRSFSRWTQRVSRADSRSCCSAIRSWGSLQSRRSPASASMGARSRSTRP